MFRCILDSSLLQKGEVDLPAEEARHLIQVLRARKGDGLELLDGCGLCAQAQIIHADKRQARVRIDSVEEKVRSGPQVTLIQALPKNAAMDFIVQKATELGVDCIQPLLSEFSVQRIKASDVDKKIQRWSEISKSALKQSGMPWAPKILAPQTLTQLLSSFATTDSLQLMADLSPDVNPLKEVLRRSSTPVPNQVICWVGPEGGFSDSEVAQNRTAGIQSVSLGAHVLRAETAALYLLSSIAYEYGN